MPRQCQKPSIGAMTVDERTRMPDLFVLLRLPSCAGVPRLQRERALPANGNGNSWLAAKSGDARRPAPAHRKPRYRTCHTSDWLLSLPLSSGLTEKGLFRVEWMDRSARRAKPEEDDGPGDFSFRRLVCGAWVNVVPEKSEI
jgi:hypothetical protein